MRMLRVENALSMVRKRSVMIPVVTSNRPVLSVWHVNIIPGGTNSDVKNHAGAPENSYVSNRTDFNELIRND